MNIGLVATFTAQPPEPLAAALQKLVPVEKPGPHYEDDFLKYVDRDGADLTVMRTGDEVVLEIAPVDTPYSTDRLVQLASAMATWDGLKIAEVAHMPSAEAAFVPRPPIANVNHAVLTTDDDVRAAFTDPDAFWPHWTVTRAGKLTLCTRALDALDEPAWLAATFAASMDLARAAKPRLTRYADEPRWAPAFATWWDGANAFASPKLHAQDKCYDLVADDRPLTIREIYEVRALVKASKFGRTVRVTFRSQALAMQERRPLLDAGARVFHGTTELD